MIVINLYDHLEKTIIAEIHKYKNITVSDQNPNKPTKQPSYPYITYLQYDESSPSPDPNSTCLLMNVQLKAVSNNQNQAKQLGFFLRHIWFKNQPKVDLYNQNIVPDIRVGQAPQSGATFLQNFSQFTYGADMKFYVYFTVSDETQKGILGKANYKFSKKG